MRRKVLWLLWLCLLLCPVLAQARERALLIGVDDFVSRESTAPSSANNVQAMEKMFKGALNAPELIVTPGSPVITLEGFERLVQATFGGAEEGDVSYLYLSTHGVYDPYDGSPPMLLLSDGKTEIGLTPAQLQSAFEGIGGTKVLILDACFSGAFIGKGMSFSPEEVFFLGEEFKVLCSSGAMEPSWYWSGGSKGDVGAAQGQFYFTQALVQCMSAEYGYPADQNSDGRITLTEVYQYLLLNHAASTPQVYPQRDDFVLLRYDPDEPLPTGMEASPVMDVTFTGTVLDRDTRQIGIEFIATRPTRVAYQLVYQRNGEWDFEGAQLIYDGAERFLTQNDQQGAVSAGRKVRSLKIRELEEDAYGYVLVQVVTIDHGRLNVHAGRVVCIPPAEGSMDIAVDTDAALTLSDGREMRVFVSHPWPCALSIAVMDAEGRTVYRLCHRQSTRPGNLDPEGSVFYWDGRLKDGTSASPGTYTLKVTADVNGQSTTVVSEPFTVYE